MKSLDRDSIDVIGYLRTVSWLHEADDNFILQIAKHTELFFVSSQEQLITKGDLSRDFYIVYSGLFLGFHTENEEIGFISQGDMMGELTLFEEGKRTINVKAIRDSIVFRIPNQKIVEALEQYPQVAMNFTKYIVNRTVQILRDNKTKKIKKTTNITFVFLGDRDKCCQFMIKLLDSMQELSKAICISPEKKIHENANVYGYGVYPKLGNLTLLEMSALSRSYETIFMTSDCESTDWNNFCIRNSDRIIFLLNQETELSLYPIEEYVQSFLGKKHPQEFIYIHDCNKPIYSEIRKFIVNRHVGKSYHVNLRSNSSVTRIARIISNRNINLVLSGGGPNGWIHVGVIKALVEQGIIIDIFAGVSAGSHIGGLAARGLMPGDIERSYLQIYKKIVGVTLSSIQFPYASLLSSRWLDKAFSNKLFSDLYFEDLPFNFFCLACNLHTLEDVIFEKGPLGDAVTASSTIPGVMSPKLINGELYIDGGASNTLPIDVMQDKYGGITIGVDVARERGISIASGYKYFPSTWEIIIDKLNPFSKKGHCPNMSEIINRSVVIGNKRKLDEVKKLTKYIIKPHISKKSILNFKELIQCGYIETKSKLAEWKI